jgi:hypothetical protein
MKGTGMPLVEYVSLLSFRTVKDIPHWSQPTHIMSLMQYIEAGSVKMMCKSQPGDREALY